MGAVESSTTRYQGTPPSNRAFTFSEYDVAEGRWFDVQYRYGDESDDEHSDKDHQHNRSGSNGKSVRRSGRRVVRSASLQPRSDDDDDNDDDDDEQDFHSVSGESVSTADSFMTAEGTPASFASAQSPRSGATSGGHRRRTRNKSSRSKRRKLSVSFHGLAHDENQQEAADGAQPGTHPRSANAGTPTVEVTFEDEMYGGPSPRKLRFSLADGSLTKERLEALSQELQRASRREAAVTDQHVQHEEIGEPASPDCSPRVAKPPNIDDEEEDFIDANFSVPHRRKRGSSRNSSRRSRGRSSIGVKLASLANEDGNGDASVGDEQQQQQHPTATFDSFDELNDLIRRGIEALEASGQAADGAPAVSLEASDLRRLLLLAGDTRQRLQKTTATPSPSEQLQQQQQQPQQQPQEQQRSISEPVVTAQPVDRFRSRGPKTSSATGRTPSRTPSRHKYKDTATYIETFSVDPDYWAAPVAPSNRERAASSASASMKTASGRRDSRQQGQCQPQHQQRNRPSTSHQRPPPGKENQSPQKQPRQSKAHKPALQPATIVKPKLVTYSTPIAPVIATMTTRSKRKLQPPLAVEESPNSPDTRVAAELWGTPYIASTIRANKKRRDSDQSIA